MKKYKSLKSVFHQDDRSTAEQEAQRRRSNGFETNFEMNGNKLFYAVTPQLLLLQEQVLLNERTLEVLAADIPPVARRSYLYELITQEITASHEIEGVRSTRHEIQQALEAEPGENRKFRQTARLYLELSDGQVKAPTTLDEIREVYDRLFGAEIVTEDRPDGDLFRLNPVYVYDGADKGIHAGSATEEDINKQLQAMLDHLADDEAPSLLSRVVSHFMFEAVHPFYDGNGRLGRFLLSVQLQEVFSAYTVLTLSYLINQRRAEYYKAFTEVEEPLNMADATSFVQTMLGFIRDAQQRLIDDFVDKKYLMEGLKFHVHHLSQSAELPQDTVSTLFILGQVHLFGGERGLDWDTLSEVIGKSRSTTRKYITELEERGLAQRVSSRPLRIRLSEKGLALLFPEQ